MTEPRPLEYDLWDPDQDGMASPGTSPEYEFNEETQEWDEV